MSINVDFPDPFGPIVKIISPELIANDRSSMVTVSPNSFDLQSSHRIDDDLIIPDDQLLPFR
jgi:hypothetical protein